MALRDSELAAGVAVLADPAAWDDPGAPDRLARLLHANAVPPAAFLAAGAEATYLTAAAAAGGAGADLLHALTRAGGGLLLAPPAPAAAEQLAGHGQSQPLLATAHLWRWHPVAVTASDAVEARSVGAAVSVEVRVGASPGPAWLAGALDVLGLVLGGDDVATLQAQDAAPRADRTGEAGQGPQGQGPQGPQGPPGGRWRGHTRGGTPVRVSGPEPGVPAAGCSITVTGSKGHLNAIMTSPWGRPGAEQGRLEVRTEGRTEKIPVPGTDPMRVLVDRFSRAVLGASPWGWSFARDLRLQALADAAAGEAG